MAGSASAATIIAGASLAVGAAGAVYQMTRQAPGGSGLMQSTKPQAEAPPEYTDPAIQAAARTQEFAAANAKGRASTMLTGGLGDTSTATTDKKQLLGVS